MLATLDRHFEICFVKLGYVLGGRLSVFEDYFKEGSFIRPGRPDTLKTGLFKWYSMSLKRL